MSTAELLELVAEMRHAQKEYFRTRSQTALEASKRLERRVDLHLAERGQRSLFPMPQESHAES